MGEIIDRSPPGLVNALCRRINALLAPSFWYEAEQFESGDNEEYHSPHVHAQKLPVSKTADTERDKSKDYPLVLVVCVSGTVNDFSITEFGSEIKIQIHFGGYSKESDNQGWRIPMAMLWRVLQDLLSDTILDGYKLKAPVTWSPADSENPPYYAAMIETVWMGCPPAVEVPSEDENLYGKDNNNETPVAQNESGKG